MYKYNAVITNVVDGDTFDLDIDLGFHIHIHERVRLFDVDCPEKTARYGTDEKIVGKYIAEWAKKELTGRPVIINTCSFESSLPIYLDTDSFGRWLVNMYVDWGEGYTLINYTYNARGFNKKHPDYDLQKLLKKIKDEQSSDSFAF